jgi:Lanthionine synthetase C-like protein
VVNQFSKEELSILDDILKAHVKVIAQSEAVGETLSYGRAGLLHFYTYYQSYIDLHNNEDKSQMLLNEIFDAIGSETDLQGYGLYNGLTGLLIIILNLRKHQFLDLEDQLFHQLESYIFDWAIEEGRNGNFDFFEGAGGVIHYFTEKYIYLQSVESEFLPKVSAQVKAFVDLVNIKVKFIDEYIYFENTYYSMIEQKPSALVNFGIAHGMTNVMLSFLKYQLASGDLTSKTLLGKYYKTISGLNKNVERQEPYFFVNEYNPIDCDYFFQQRLGWCHSDLNLVHFLLLYKKVDDSIAAFTDDAISALLKRNNDYKDNLLDNPFICHGYGGVAQYYYHLYKISGKEVFLNGWHQFILKVIAHYSTFESTYEEKLMANENHSLFYGNLGVALALITALKIESHTWSEIIMI